MNIPKSGPYAIPITIPTSTKNTFIAIIIPSVCTNRVYYTGSTQSIIPEVTTEFPNITMHIIKTPRIFKIATNLCHIIIISTLSI